MVNESKLIWNPYVPGYFQNPYKHFGECREQNPIHKGIHDSWMFFRYKDVSNILRSDDFLVLEISEYFKEKEPFIFKNSNTCPYLSKGTKMWPMNLNGDTHKMVRNAMAKALANFTTEEFIKESIKSTSQKYRKMEEFDLLFYTSTFLCSVLENILGISDYESIQKIIQYSNLLAKTQDVFIPNQIYHQINDAILWGNNIFKNSAYKDSILSNLKDFDCSEDDIHSIMTISFMTAFLSSKDSLAYSLSEIIKNKELTDFVINCNPSELNLLIEELLRYSSSLQFTVRVNKNRLDLDDISIPPNSKLFLCLASANRDPRVFENPEELIPTRSPNPHLALGGGSHHCIGSSLARQQMRLCLKPMVDFFKNYKIKSGEPINWNKQIFIRSAESIVLTLK